jgi:hypothetical protein
MRDVNKAFIRNMFINLVDADYLSLGQKLLKAGGKKIAPMPEPHLNALLQRGKVMNNDLRFHKMDNSACHSNVALLWNRKGYAICTGWALSDDNIWRQHSWCLDRRATIVETTESREIYFGIKLEESEALLMWLNDGRERAAVGIRETMRCMEEYDRKTNPR